MSVNNGSTGTVTIVTEQSASGLAVPTSAISTVGGQHFVTVDDGGSTRRVAVQVGVLGREWTSITSGLTAGQEVVLADLGKALPSSATESSGNSGATYVPRWWSQFPTFGAAARTPSTYSTPATQSRVRHLNARNIDASIRSTAFPAALSRDARARASRAASSVRACSYRRSSHSPPPPHSAATSGGGNGFGGSGKLTGRSGSTLEVEGFTGTTKVIVTSSTKYRQTEDTDAARSRRARASA